MISTEPSAASVKLYWLPLGAGGHFVRWNGRLFEWIVARREHRSPCALYHSALEVRIGRHRSVIEMAPVWAGAEDHGAVQVGPVGAHWLGRSRFFQYEIRQWRDGLIPDADEAVSIQCVGDDHDRAQRLLQLVPEVPALTWGRDELRAGDMWNSNSVVSWLLTRSGHPVSTIALPRGGRAPGWRAGLVLAERQAADRA